MANKKKEKKEELVPTRKSVHVVFLSCPHCGTEKDHIEMCDECGEAMRVIDVVEKFGEDAERFLKRVEKRKLNGTVPTEEEEEYVDIENEEPNIILMGADEEIDDGGIDPTTDDDVSLDVIYPDEDETPRKGAIPKADDDLSKALEQLDSEEDDDMSAQDFGFEDGEIPEL
jgi:hypothetical protein